MVICTVHLLMEWKHLVCVD